MLNSFDKLRTSSFNELKTEKGLAPILIVILIVVGMTFTAGGVYYYQKTKTDQAKQKLEQEKKELSKQIEEKEKKITELEKEEVTEAPKEKISVTSSRGDITVESPLPGTQITSPVKIAGRASVFEAQFSARIKNSQGKVIGTTSIMATKGAPDWGDFEVILEFTQPSKTQVGTIEVYDVSEKDGSIDDIAEIQVILKGK